MTQKQTAISIPADGEPWEYIFDVVMAGKGQGRKPAMIYVFEKKFP